MTQALRSSPYTKPFEERLSQWEAQLNEMQGALRLWLDVQRRWSMLWPIFQAEEVGARARPARPRPRAPPSTHAQVARSIPLEARRFASADSVWRKVTALAQQRAEALQVAYRAA